VALRALQHAHVGVEGGLAARGPPGCPRRGNGKSGVYSGTSSSTIGNWSRDSEPMPSLDRERCSAAKVTMDCPSSPRCAVRVVAVWETTEPAQEFTAGGLARPRTGQVAAASPASLGDTARRLVHVGGAQLSNEATRNLLSMRASPVVSSSKDLHFQVVQCQICHHLDGA
jgi:hypothetical protein